MKLITQYEPKIHRYMVPGAFNRIDFYGQAGLDVTPEPTGRARELSVVELLEDPSQTRFITFNEVRAVERNWGTTVDEGAYRTLVDTGEYAQWLRRAAQAVPKGIEIKREHLYSQMAEKLDARWWEVSW
jgi:hypothetical protein